jgi:hypothetical protein
MNKLTKINETYLNLADIKNNRECGNSTRLIDTYIQEFFNKPEKWILIRDHNEKDRNSLILRNKVTARLFNEHNLRVNYDFDIDSSECRIMNIIKRTKNRNINA